MNKFICYALVLFAVFASGNCGSYGKLNHYDLGSYGHPSAASASSAYAAPSYSLGHGNYDHESHSYAAPAHSYAAPAHSYAAPAHSAPAKYAAPKYSVQPAYATELYPGQQNYKAYNSAPTYSQVALPVVPSVPVAKLFVPHHHGSHYGSAAPY